MERALAALAAGALPLLLLGYSGGPPVRRTGAPGDRVCLDAGCHVGTRFDDSPIVTLDTGSDLTYVPGGPKQRWTVRNLDPLARAYGMQLTVRAASDPARVQAGDLTSIDATTAVICEDEKFKGTTGCTTIAPVQFIHHTEPRVRGVFEFDWTPPAANLGELVVYLASNASVTGQRDSRIHLRSFRLRIAGTVVVNAASFQPAFTAGSWISIFGAGLSGDRVQVLVNGRPATVTYVSSVQINALAPDEPARGDVPIEVRRDGVTIASLTGRMELIAPGLFPPGSSSPGEVHSFHGTGFGRAEAVAFRIGGAKAEVRSAAPISPGLYRFDVVIPQLAPGRHPVEAEVEGVAAPTASLDIVAPGPV